MITWVDFGESPAPAIEIKTATRGILLGSLNLDEAGNLLSLYISPGLGRESSTQVFANLLIQADEIVAVVVGKEKAGIPDNVLQAFLD